MEPSWFAHPDLMNVAITALFSGFIFFAIRALKKIDLNQQELFTRLHALEKDFYELSGEHKIKNKEH